ncbi:hypothetical protein PSTG_00264 [Puccinia striiformis f. sp. tritici PST-78]|uniref:Nudix hydrolase domain-containing protein n=1 Tax=Puccinia striiformis f. sp. tritici PST-78 TaxID=1165861 RepID=A0A0L0W4K5_9BASI|nr:hypothetical protein PSTG_00264 [Puccinia striiformis f. sp. tritici PST-78]
MVPRLQSVLSGSALSLDQRALTGVDLGNIRLSLSSSNPDKLLSPSLYHKPKRHAAVLLGLCNTNLIDGPGLIFTLRSQKMRTHPGEISFPGGHEDPGIDQSLLGTALREAHEEIGIMPHQIEFLGSLEPVFNNAGSTLVWPFVVFIHSLDRAQSAPSPNPIPMIPRLMSNSSTEPLQSPKLVDLHGKHQAAEVDLVFQISLKSLLEPETQSSSSFRGDITRPYLEWDVRSEIIRARNNPNPTDRLMTTSSLTNYKLWGLTAWFIKWDCLSYSSFPNFPVFWGGSADHVHPFNPVYILSSPAHSCTRSDSYDFPSRRTVKSGQ